MVWLCVMPPCMFQHPSTDTAGSRLRSSTTLHTRQPCKLCCTPGLTLTTLTCLQSVASVLVSFHLDQLTWTGVHVDSKRSCVSLAGCGVHGRLYAVCDTQGGAIKNNTLENEGLGFCILKSKELIKLCWYWFCPDWYICLIKVKMILRQTFLCEWISVCVCVCVHGYVCIKLMSYSLKGSKHLCHIAFWGQTCLLNILLISITMTVTHS